MPRVQPVLGRAVSANSRDRLTPVAMIPMYTPEEAIVELEYAVKTLGLKVAMMPSLLRRPIRAAVGPGGEPNPYAQWLDMLALDSEHDYDPVWAKCLELGVAPTFHTVSKGVGTRISPSNAVYNHIGHFGVAGEAICKALFLGGVTRRFPKLKFAFLEGGVGWACGLYSDLIGHWKKRNPKALEDIDPANLNREMLAASVPALWRQCAGRQARALEARGRGVFAADRRPRRVARRFRGLRDRARGTDPRPLHSQFLFRLRSGRPERTPRPSIRGPTRTAPGSTRSSAPISAISTSRT